MLTAVFNKRLKESRENFYDLAASSLADDLAKETKRRLLQCDGAVLYMVMKAFRIDNVTAPLSGLCLA